MRYFVTITLIITLLLCNQLSYSQSNTSIGFSVGGAKLSMGEVNDDLEDTYDYMSSAGAPISLILPHIDGHGVKVYISLMEVFKWKEDANMTVNSRLKLFVW